MIATLGIGYDGSDGSEQSPGIEPAFSIVETVCCNVKRWRTLNHIQRWVGFGLLVSDRKFLKVTGFRRV